MLKKKTYYLVLVLTMVVVSARLTGLVDGPPLRGMTLVLYGAIIVYLLLPRVRAAFTGPAV